MARYIDADKLVESLRADYDREGEKADTYAVNGDVVLAVKYSHGQFCYLNAMERVKDAPTADVAPRKENDVPRYIKLPQPEYLPPTAEELEAFATKLYQSPIEIIMQEMQTQLDGEVFKATQAYGINVDKDELIKALQYDRDQYDKGFADGSRIDTTAIRAEVAREIFEEIEKYMMDSVDVTHTAYKTIGSSTFAILKKKYTEGQK
jgi:uncharacterized protein YkuJ